ncbi:EAL domain-containing protein [Xanthomonas oryzae pv. oryzae]|uniref:C-di-GMP phosphodiesterase A n=1 Tax=Xanthomonas oryzae pv. oryzae (strain KACC10331 / KXO85) TaxID=291331 RepID=Q5GZQ4_XANOR|nr:EAL domain-containing protein [Xanthomonas oryzae]AAW75817.1 c-di-GMP phosphodiesterase A [Xanthomonas oryzae pv. oryzae KACC 10331]AOS02732.1 c-di-GMP phosphodiesterase [Xanthomonas oryzae pv. oryzae]AOS19379.1 c-di-GMP phosphodiesterase [Xanthomonas oryzae pv. oryzae]AOS23533.1 c-di-GMP phosphodiesterase [Xanthomonas oryzae pv. oryzae]AOS27665.1 c-di-GMP phosphodiesterase [Xanthomonas oryzae pv. oryzae]
MWNPVSPPGLEVVKPTRLGAGNPELLHLVDAAASGGPPLMIFHVDIDHFASINENMSGEVGDQALTLAARRLQEFLGTRGKLWRHGSDEMIVVAVRREDTPLPEDFAEEIRQQLELPLSVLPYTLFMTGKVGISLCPEHSTAVSTLLDYAEEASYQAAREGGNTVRLYTHNSATNAHSESIIARQIVDAIPHGELRLRYQPLVSARDGRIVGMEALLRWQSPTLGMLVPERFMRTAERLGVIVQIGEWVLQNAVRQARLWRDQGFDDFSIAINVSTLQLLRPGFFNEVMAMLQTAGVPAQFVTLEINESALTNNVNFVHETMANLRNEGISLSLDNFGTGDSSLSALVRYPVDRLKIDRSFIKSAPAGSREAAIARAIIAMGHQLGMTVIANGVESQAQLGFLRRNDCDIFQGYLFGEPMSAESAGMALRRRYLRPESFAESRPDRTLLLLDDEENVLRSLVRLFRRDGYRILAAGNVRDAFDLLATNDVQVILSDQRMSDMSGTEFLGRVKMLYPDTVRLVLSGYTDLATVTEAINRGAIYRFLTKPWNDDELREHIRQAFRTHDELRNVRE